MFVGILGLLLSCCGGDPLPYAKSLPPVERVVGTYRISARSNWSDAKNFRGSWLKLKADMSFESENIPLPRDPETDKPVPSTGSGRWNLYTAPLNRACMNLAFRKGNHDPNGIDGAFQMWILENNGDIELAFHVGDPDHFVSIRFERIGSPETATTER
jgi:hypothetical protein